MLVHREVPQTPSEAVRPSRLLPCKYSTPLTPLECALPRCLATVHSERLTSLAKSFGMRTYRKTGGRGLLLIPPFLLAFTPKETLHSSPHPKFRMFFQVPYALNIPTFKPS